MDVKTLTRSRIEPYDEDFACWAAETARLLRERCFAEIDVEHLAEEIEDMGKNQRRELFSRLTVIIHHLLKWQQQPEQRSGGWKATVVTQRAELGRLIEHSPSLQRQLGTAVAEVYRHAARAAAAETGLPLSAFPSECPFTAEQILEEDFFPDLGPVKPG